MPLVAAGFEPSKAFAPQPSSDHNASAFVHDEGTITVKKHTVPRRAQRAPITAREAASEAIFELKSLTVSANFCANGAKIYGAKS